MNSGTALKMKSLSAGILAIILLLACAVSVSGYSESNLKYANAEIFASNPSASAEVKVTANNIYGDSGLYTSVNSTTGYTSFTGAQLSKKEYTSGQPYIGMADKYALNNYMSSSDFTMGEIIVPGCNENYVSEQFGTDDDGRVLTFGSKLEYNLVFTFKLSDELRKVLKDKMLVVSATPYVVTSSSNQFAGYNISDVDTATLNLALYDGNDAPTSAPSEPYSSIRSVSSSDYVNLPIEDKFVAGASGSISPGEYKEGAFLQVTLCNWAQNGSNFALAIREVGVRIAATFNTSISIATVSGTGIPSNDPADIGKVTTCLVQGDDRHENAPSNYAKPNDILDINLVLRRDSTVMTLDTSPYTETEPSYENCKDGTMFRRLFLNPDDEFLITWTVTDGSVTDEGAIVDGDNKSGQAVKFMVYAGGSATGKLVIKPTISYRDRQNNELKQINSSQNTSISVNIDAIAPYSPTLDMTTDYYQNYLDENERTYYTTVQSSLNEDDRDSEGNLIRLLISGSTNNTRPLFNERSLDNAGGSNSIIYYKTKYVGEEVPATVAEKNAEAFIGPVFYKPNPDEEVYELFEGRMVQGGDYYKMVMEEVNEGSFVPPNTYFVRNNGGQYVLTEDTVFVYGTSYYTCEKYNYENSGEYNGIYANVGKEAECQYGNIYVNMAIGVDDTGKPTITKAGVWSIEFITYDLVGKSTMCASKYFIMVDITDYEFEVQFALGGDFEQQQLNSDNISVTVATLDAEGNKSSYVSPETINSGDIQRNVFRLRRANKVCIRVEFKNTETYNNYVLTQFSVGNIGFSTSKYEYKNRETDLDYAFINIPNADGTTKKVNYTFEVDASFCMDETLRRMQFMFKRTAEIVVTNTNQTFDGTSKPVTTTVPALQAIGGQVNVVTRYYTSDTYEDEYLVKYGENQSNIPVDAGTYYYYSEISNHQEYYGKATGPLTINKKQPSLSTVTAAGINYGESLAKIDFDPEERNNLGQQLPSDGLYAVFSDVGKDYFVSTMSSDRIPGYYELVVDDKTSSDYLKPKAGEVNIIIRFTPVKGTVAGYEVVYQYDDEGNFIPDTNYTSVTCDRTLTVVHDDKVSFNLSDAQEGGIVKTTTMSTTTGDKEVKYVEFTYTGQRKTLSYTLTSSYETDEFDPSELLNLKDYALVTYAQTDSLTLSEREIALLKYGDVSPLESGIYAVRIRIDESRCNYSKDIYTYIKINKVSLTVSVEASSVIFDYQYEKTPTVDVKYGVTDYGNVVEGFTFEYYYYESGKTQEELLSEENRVKEEDLRQYTGNPEKAGEYYLKVSIADPNYEGTGYVRYIVQAVNNENQRFSASWPSLNGSQINPQYHLTYGQPLSEANLGTSSKFTYPYLTYRNTGSATTTTKNIPGKVFLVSVKYNDWLADKGLEDSVENRNDYLEEMKAVVPDYSITPYNWFLCFSAQSTDGEGNIVFDTNFEFIYEATELYVGKAEIDWTQVEVSPVIFGQTVESGDDLEISKRLGVLYSVNGNVPLDEDYYVKNVRYIYKYIDPKLYTYGLTSNKPNLSAAGTINIELKAIFGEANNYHSEYIGSNELIIEKKTLTISYSYAEGEDKESKTYKAFKEEEFYENLIYDGYIEEIFPGGMSGVFEYEKDGDTFNFSELNAGEYNVIYTLDNKNYAGEAVFRLEVKKSNLEVNTAPDIAGADINVVYNAKVGTAVGFLGGRLTAEGGEVISYTAGSVVIGAKLGVYVGATLTEYEITEELKFGNAGTKVRIYYNFIPSDTINYAEFIGTNENGGYLEVTVGKADVSNNMALAVKGSGYIYKDIKYTDDEIKGITEYTLSEGPELDWEIKITNTRGEIPAYNAYLNAGEYIITVQITDDNYSGSVSTNLSIGKKAAYIELKAVNDSKLENTDGITGIKKSYKGNSQNLDFDVYELNGGIKTVINEATTVTFYRDGAKLYANPSDIGYYDATISMSTSVNYELYNAESGEKVQSISSFLIIGVNLKEIELVNTEQVYTVQKTVTVYMGSNNAECTLSYEKDGVNYKDLPIEAGTYDIYLNFAAYENNGYEDKINAKEINPAYQLVITPYYTEIYTATEITTTYTGEETEKFSPYTSPYGLALEYSYKLQGTNEYTQSTLEGLGALDAGIYDVRITIQDKNYQGEKIVKFTVNQARLTEKTKPVFGEYQYNTDIEPEYKGEGSYVFGATEVSGTFRIGTEKINTLSVGEHSVSYEFIPDSGNYQSAGGTVSLQIVKQVLGQDFITLGDNGNLLITSDYTVEYNNTRQSIKVNFDTTKIYGYPQENGDFSVNLKYSINGNQQSPLAIGTYTVTAEVSSKNYTCVKTWDYKLVITTGTPLIAVKPEAVKTFKIGDTVTSADFTGGKAVINSAQGTEIFGTFELAEEVTLSSANTNRLTMIFTPTDTANFKSVSFEVTVEAIGTDSMTLDGINKPEGQTANGTDWSGKVFFPTFIPTGEGGIGQGTHTDGSYCGAVISIIPKSGESRAEYGLPLGAYEIKFVCADSGCKECQAAVERLQTYGTLAFVKGSDYIPSVGEEIEVSYKLRIEVIENSAKYNNMSGTISTEEIIVKKNLNRENSEFELITFTGKEEWYVLTIYTKTGEQFGTIAKLGNETVTEGAFKNDGGTGIEINTAISGGKGIISFATRNYVAEGIETEIKEYRYVAPEDFSVGNNAKAYDGKGINVADLKLSINNTAVAIDDESYSITVYDGEGNETEGKYTGEYKVVIFLKDDRNGYYGILETEFTVVLRDISNELYLNKSSEVIGGETIYYDSYGSGTHTVINAIFDGTALEQGTYKAEIKKAELGEEYYTTVGSLGVGLYTVRISVTTGDYRGVAEFTYRIDAQRIIMSVGANSYTVEYGTEEQNSFSIMPSFKDEYGNGFTFDERGGYSVYYYSANYPKQTQKPMNAGTYTIAVEANSENYRITGNTVTYIIKQRTTRIATAPTAIAVDSAGNNLIYGQKLSSIGLRTDSASVTDSSGNIINGVFSVKETEGEIIPDAGERSITVIFTPANKNYATSETTITIKIAKKVVRIEFTNLTAFYNGTSRREELAYKEPSDPITIIFEFVNATGQTVDPVTAGIYTIKANVINSNYTVVMSNTTGGGTPVFTVKRAEVIKDAVINPTASSVGVGESLNKSSLSGGKIYYNGFTEPVKGSFSYVEGGRAFESAGIKEVEYLFVPDDNINFTSYKGSVSIVIGRGLATVTPGENVFEYGTKADFTKINLTTSPAGLEADISYEFSCDGVTYKQGDIIPAGTYWFTCWVDGANYYSEVTKFSYVVNKKEIDIDFIDANGQIVTAYTTGYGETLFKNVQMYDANTEGKRTYLLQDEATIRNNIQYKYVSRGGETPAYESYNAPRAIGSYDITVTLIHDNYTATKTIIYRISTGRVEDIVFDVDTLIHQTYGSVVAPIVTTSPSNLSYYIIYQGYNTTMPTAVGSYNITVYVDDENYAAKQVSAVFRINPKPITVTDITVKDKAYDGVPTLEISGALSGVLYGDEVFLSMKAQTFGGEIGLGEHFVEITECKISGLHASNYTLEYPEYDGKVKIYENKVYASGSNSYIISANGFADGTSVEFREVSTERNQTSVWSKMVGVEASVIAYTIKVNNAEVINSGQYKICVEIPEQYRNKEFTVEFDGALKGQPISYTREGNYISFSSSMASGEIVFQTAEFKYEYVVIAAVLLIILIAVTVLLILNPLQHRKQVTDPRVPKEAIRNIKKEHRGK